MDINIKEQIDAMVNEHFKGKYPNLEIMERINYYTRSIKEREETEKDRYNRALKGVT